ncbi:SDR family oxidoreductase [Pyruvatibacter mobilis]|uniref:SDR family oxidoreductase n=1 Tax=Pyruvatibacter mobilis TaxID=1712261 RepID=A0A845Q8A0_9HYPH|nr:SDR family oxidoreductase [Pyruvatibacter mobilis]NBG94885.1 SDR family oxidoreductase [Pyruvatibacter mobilis]QJD76102.1 SDR family oxidoreductase [Pyruvatibacter mobilis]GGD21196.1 3-oxoacyl-ACP reductase [Pyruvatibacter mobilis]
MDAYKPLDRSIKGRTAIITGAASGMGRATAHLFAREGANVAVTDLRQDACDAVVAEIEEAGITTARAHALDVGDADAIKAVVARTAEEFGGIDIVVNNAGFALPVPLGEDGYEDSWDKSLSVMLTSHQRLVSAALPWLRRSDAARIVNVASTEGLGATPRNSAYVAAKHGVIGLTRAMAVEFGKEGITANCICPGPILTGITEAIPDEHKQVYANRRTALRRYGLPEEVANITLSVVLPAASYLTGVAIPVDGGLTIRNA